MRGMAGPFLGTAVIVVVWGLALHSLLPWLAAIPIVLLALFLVLAGLRVEAGTVAFLHPIGKDGGGGERVLWCAILAAQEADPGMRVVLFTDADDKGLVPTSEELAARARDRFGVEIKAGVTALPLRRTWLVKPETWPRLTLVGMAVGMVLLGIETLWVLQPEVLVDTAGLTFALPLARLLGTRTAAYVHYPIISTDMLQRVRDGVQMYNNRGSVSGSQWKTAIKVAYYRVFALIYGLAGAFVDIAMVNSSWTLGHIKNLWFGWGHVLGKEVPALVYPPCNTESLCAYPLEYKEPGTQQTLISVAQFRPEKDHKLQLDAFKLACSRGTGLKGVKLLLVGGCRDAKDAERVEALKEHAKALGLEDRVVFKVNAPYPELQDLLGSAHAGLHTMLDEHFGIVVVEYMAAGAPPIAHSSGGPKADIVRHGRTGYLARTVEEYADAIDAVMGMGREEWMQMAEAGRERCRLFGDDVFSTHFKRAMRPLLSAPPEGVPGSGNKDD